MNSLKKIIQEVISGILKEEVYTLYHGTNNSFDKFDLSHAGENTGSSWHGLGIYFTDNKSEASWYGDKIVTANVTINNPLDLTKIKDSSVDGSGLLRLLNSIPGFGNIKFQNYNISELVNILNKTERGFDYKNISFSEGNNGNFKHVWYQDTDGKEYVIRNRTKTEYENKEHLKDMIIRNIFHEKYNISNLPIRISEIINPSIVTKLAKQAGYDAIIAPNSNFHSGNEYVIFDNSQVHMLKESHKIIMRENFYHGSPYEFNKFDISRVGTGDERSKFGWGLYFTDSPSTALQYAKDLSIGKLKNSGFNVYEVRLIGLDNFIPFEEQIPDHVHDCIINTLARMGKEDSAEQFRVENEEYGLWTMDSTYQWLEAVLGTSKDASEFLYNNCNVYGIIGETAWLEGKVFVAFSDNIVKIINHQKAGEMQGPEDEF
jgi:hypothetical protein